jgi:hypothetical protein
VVLMGVGMLAALVALLVVARHLPSRSTA